MSILSIVKFGIRNIADDTYKAARKLAQKTAKKCRKITCANQHTTNQIVSDTFSSTNTNFSKKIQKQITNSISPQELNLDQINELKINNIRFVGNNNISGGTFEIRNPDDLIKLKNAGIKRIADFRTEGKPEFVQFCRDNGFEYVRLPLDHTRALGGITAGKIEVTDDFVKSLKKYFDMSNKGNLYQGCHYGIDRTNLGLTLNYLLNPKSQQVPRIVSWGEFDFGNVVNRTIKTAKKIAKKLTPEQIKELGLSDDFMKILNERIYELRRTNGVLQRF